MQMNQWDRSAASVFVRSLLKASPVLALSIALLVTSHALADVPDWGDVSGVETITVVTETEEGEAHETTIWLVMVDGKGYIRTTNRSGWGKNIRRNPAIAVQVEGTEHPVSVTFVEGGDVYDRITARFREKYGFGDAFIGILRGSNPPIMQLDSRMVDPS